MARGGYRPGAGRPRKTDGKPARSVLKEAKAEAKKAGLTPLDYMLQVMNDETAENDRRDKMAIAAAPFVHVKPADAGGGKKAERQAAAEKVGGRFAPPAPPKVVVDNTR